ncbi:transcription elongation factor SPT4 [Nematocida homosporus]|uniref:transcription elongation factor SPT4 n=1 Tax=Nematocida homosporus TaxID=1912981 RepID=UPI00221FE849|nr:transcription elongation factor SPT4 [Nematocida homosporus]KAI5184934.1 transcription elongation factor SPT4 [Nematocida homosporus]
MVIPPAINKKLRACLGCSLVKTQSQFKESGCDNCVMLRMKDSTDNVLDCTTDRFSGLIAIINAKSSWMARWQHLDGYTQGLYAITMDGDLPESKIMALERAGRTYIPRDKSFAI